MNLTTDRQDLSVEIRKDWLNRFVQVIFRGGRIVSDANGEPDGCPAIRSMHGTLTGFMGDFLELTTTKRRMLINVRAVITIEEQEENRLLQ